MCWMNKDELLEKLLNIIVIIVVSISIPFLCWAFLFLHETSVEIDSQNRNLSEVHSVTEETNAKGKVKDTYSTNEALTTALFNATMYDLSIEYMDKGYVVTTPEFSISDDTEYTLWKESIMPDKSINCTVSPVDQYLSLNGSINNSDISYFKQYINNVPIQLINKLISEGWRFILTDSPIDKTDSHFTAGQTNFEEKTITIYADSSSMDTSIIHEVGHVLYLYTADALSSVGITSTKNDELNNVYVHSANGSIYIYWNYEEKLASLLHDYIFFPKELEQQAPTIYKIYDTTISNL